MVVVPARIPATIPEVLPMVPAVVLVLLHTPPEVVLLSDVVLPSQTDGVPEIAAGVTGSDVTVTTFVAVHPPGRV